MWDGDEKSILCHNYNVKVLFIFSISNGYEKAPCQTIQGNHFISNVSSSKQSLSITGNWELGT